MLSLPGVTLVAVTDINIEAHQYALDLSCRGIEFGDVQLLTPKLGSIEEWNRFIVYDLGDYIDTEHALLIHDDGFVVHPQSWDPAWLMFDYIGSPFPLPTDDYSYRDVNGKVQRVGNSVSLRSKHLLQLAKKENFEWKPFYGFTNEDGYVSVNMRHAYEEEGCVFAPFEQAVRFGREVPLPENQGIKPFVFHKWEGENAKYPKL